MSDNFYKILGVSENASHDEIKKAYRSLSLKFHPDKNPSPEATEVYKKINEAYDILGDEQKRKLYDVERKNPFMKMSDMGGMSSEVDEFIKSFFGGSMPFGMRMSGMGINPEMFGGMEIPGSQFHVFHNGRPVNVNMMNKPSPIVKNVIIDIEQVFNGCTIPIEIERWIHDNNMKICAGATSSSRRSPSGARRREIIYLNSM
jgi:DnaJ-class molecular chaperone